MKKREHFARYVSLAVLIVAFSIAFVIRLVNIDVTGQGYVEDSSRNNFRKRTETIQALRGEIYDRNGKPLVTNEYSYDVYLDAGSLSTDNAKRNGTIIAIFDKVKEYGAESAFTLPESPFLEIPNQSGTKMNYEYSSSYMNTVYGKRLTKLILEITEEEELPEAKDAIEILKERYGLVNDDADPVYPEETAKKLFRIRIDMEMKNFSSSEPYTILTNVDMQLITGIGPISSPQNPRCFSGVRC